MNIFLMRIINQYNCCDLEGSASFVLRGKKIFSFIYQHILYEKI